MKRQPQRTCMGCNAKKDKREFIRIVKNKENEKNKITEKTGCCSEEKESERSFSGEQRG